MNPEEPVFCIIHNYRKHNAGLGPQPEEQEELFESATPISTSASPYAEHEEHEERPGEEHR
jgi:hypothetical protein